MAVKALKVAGFIAASIVFFNLYVLFDKTFITHTAFTFEFVKNPLRVSGGGVQLYEKAQVIRRKTGI